MQEKDETEGGRPSRDRILDAALQLFSEAGYKGAATKKIAALAGVNEVTLFRHFRTKSELFGSVIAERSPLTTIKGAVSFEGGVPLDDLFYRNLTFVLGTLRQNRHMFRLMLRDASSMPQLRQTISETAIQKGIALLSFMLERMMQEGRLRRMDPTTAARALIGMVQSHFIFSDLLSEELVDPVKEERILRGFVSIFLDGMRAEGAK